MKQCYKGHKYPNTLDNCPVCKKENELKTVVIRADVPPFNPSETTKPVSNPEQTNNEQTNNNEDDFTKTVILNRPPLQKENILIGWLIEFDSEDRQISSYQLFNKKTTIGRRKNNDIVLSDNSVSGNHCTIEFQNNGKLIIYDNDSTNGTMVNNKSVKSHIMKDNDVVLLGNLKFKIKYL